MPPIALICAQLRKNDMASSKYQGGSANTACTGCISLILRLRSHRRNLPTEGRFIGPQDSAGLSSRSTNRFCTPSIAARRNTDGTPRSATVSEESTEEAILSSSSIDVRLVKRQSENTGWGIGNPGTSPSSSLYDAVLVISTAR